MGLGDRLKQAGIRREEREAADKGQTTERQIEFNQKLQEEIAKKNAEKSGSSGENK